MSSVNQLDSRLAVCLKTQLDCVEKRRLGVQVCWYKQLTVLCCCWFVVVVVATPEAVLSCPRRRQTMARIVALESQSTLGASFGLFFSEFGRNSNCHSEQKFKSKARPVFCKVLR